MTEIVRAIDRSLKARYASRAAVELRARSQTISAG
jgi:hypothetical protein